MDAIHPSIVTAICRVQAAVGAVKKDQRNAHGGYQFASTDSIYAELTHKMAAAGLVILALEDEPPKIEKTERDGKTSQWVRACFSFILATSEATWHDPKSCRTLYIQITGPQTFQAAQSYAEKSFMRSLFKLPTGDMDLDSVAQAETVEGQNAVNGGMKRKSSGSAKKDGTDAVFATIRQQISSAATLALLEQIPDLYAEEWGTLPRRWSDLLQDEYQDRMNGLRSTVDA